MLLALSVCTSFSAVQRAYQQTISRSLAGMLFQQGEIPVEMFVGCFEVFSCGIHTSHACLRIACIILFFNLCIYP